MGHPNVTDIQTELAASGRGLVVVGTGIAIAATAGTPQESLASWDGLLRDGLDHCVRFGRQDDAWADRLRVRLASPDADALLAVAGEICAALDAPGRGEFGRWLEDTVGRFRAARRGEIEALRDLGLPLATTNYDDLLEEITGLPAATWQDTAVVEDLLRGKPLRAVLHLHGHWRRPESVILDPAAYQRAAPVVQDLLKALRLSHTLLFVGCGEGLADPNWSALRRWASTILASSRYRHFRLCLAKELPALERLHPPAERLFPVPYGAGHGDLAAYLRGIRPAAPAGAPALPVASRCFGRDAAVETLTAALCAVPARPAAVLGPAGIGKSTVTLAALHQPRVAARFGDRRYFVRCAAAESRAGLLNTLALSLGLDLGQAAATADPEARILAHLAGAPALLVLDNAETPWEAEIAGGALGFEDLLARLAAVPDVALAASFRGFERPHRPSWATTLALDPLAPADARAAFLDVAGDGYRDDPLLDPLLAEVGHLPLALVLLAAQAEGAPLAILRQRWRHAKTGMLRRPGADPREVDLEASIMLSIGSPRTTLAARRLAAVLGLLPDGLADEDLHAIDPENGDDASASLRKVGLALPRDPRLRLYSAVREVFARTLAPNRAEHDRLLAHFLELAELGERAGREGGQAAFERIAPELANLEALLTPALGEPDPAPAIAAVASILELARFTGLQQAPLFERALEAARRADAPETIARCLERIGDLSFARSDHDTARARYEEARPLFRRAGSLLGEANCIQSLGDIDLRRSDHDAARARYEEALPLYRRVGDLLGEANCIKSLGNIDLRRSDHDAARARYEEALPLYRRVGDLLGEANCIQSLGNIDLRRSDHDAARARYEEALPLFRRVGDLLGEANCIQSLGDIDLQRSDHDAARARYEEALPLFRRVGGVLGEANCIKSLGNIDLQRSDHDAARARYEEALPLYRRVGDLLGEANCIQSLGDIDLRRSDHDAARARYEEALPLFRRVGDLLGEANCIRSLGNIDLRRSDHDAARARYEEALPLYRRVGGVLGEANCIRSLGDIDLERSDHDAARARYEEALPLYRRVGSLLGEANCIRSLGDIDLRRSDHDAARARYEEALPLYRRVGSLLGEANCIKSLGDLLLAQGDATRARESFQEALELFARLPEPYSMGWTRRRLARLALAEPDLRDRHLGAARDSWSAIQRFDLIADLDREFPQDET